MNIPAILRRSFVTVLVSLCLTFNAQAQVWTDAKTLPIFGKAVGETASLYSRLPAGLKDECRPPVWSLGQNSTGIYVRFRTDSPALWLRWKSSESNVMNHMSPTGSRGLDLYVLEGGKWRFLAAGRPDLKEAVSEQRVISNMTPDMREYMVYLSLYDGVDDLYIGTEEGHPVLNPMVNSPRSGRPVVMYGTSITQGGCVTRPGMLYTSIMARELDREFINLGFSGNALFDLEIARLMASVENPSAFVLAPLCNARIEDVEARGEAFFRILRSAHPNVPVIFVQSVRYSREGYDQTFSRDFSARRVVFRNLYESLKKSGEKKIYLADPAATFPDMESSVDGTHLTDLGAQRFSDALLPVLKKALR